MTRRTRLALTMGGVVLLAVLGGAWRWTQRSAPVTLPRHPALAGAVAVWAVDDGHRVQSTDGRVPAMMGDDNPIWQPGQPVRLRGLRGETVAMQIVVSAGDEALRDVKVEVTGLPDRVTTERFVVHELHMSRRSGGRHAGQSLGWSQGAMPPGPSPGGTIADPLIPITHAQPWADYPMTVGARRHRVVWIDLMLAEDLAPGGHHGRVDVHQGETVLATLDVELDVGRAALPFRALHTMVFFELEDVVARIGSEAVVPQLWQLLHRHHLSPVFPIRDADDIRARRDALDGTLFDAQHGYHGPGVGVGADVVVLGSYGVLGPPTEASLAAVTEMVEALANIGIVDQPGRRDVFLYAVDEQCDSGLGAAWRRALDDAGDPLLANLRVGHTCSEPPASQGVDLVMVAAGLYQPATAAAGRAAGRQVWIYNGELPHTGTFLSDSWPLSLRANAWIQAHYGIERWFYWESAFWNDQNRGGKGPYDPLQQAETFHNADGDHNNGDGVLVYPGRQRAGWRDLGFDGVVPSFRLKQWRRGVQDAGYIALARALNAPATESIVAAMVAGTFESQGGPVWPTASTPWSVARNKLFDLIEAR